MIYITYDRYIELGGTMIPSEEFGRIARVVSRKVDGLTFNRLVGGFNDLTQFQRERLEESMVEFCDFEYDNEDILNSTITAYTLNGVSVKYGDTQGGLFIQDMTVSRNGYQILSQTGLTCRLI